MKMARVLKLTSPRMHGDDVIDVQRILTGLNYACGSIDGYFGPNVESAVENFQKDNRVYADGEVGTYTLRKMKSKVKEIQNKLNDLGYNCGYADGYFGSGTKSAVKDFQRDKNLSVDGIVDEETREKIFNSEPEEDPNADVKYKSTSRRLSSLHPDVADLARTFLDECENQGYNVMITTAFRSWEEQDKLYALHNGTTNAKAGQSYHNYGLAIDFAPLESNGTINWNDLAKFDRVAEIGESVGFESGKSWGDRPHLQYTFGLTWQDLFAGKRP